jgi:hypothetical protein
MCGEMAQSQDIISIQGKERFSHHKKYGWSFADYL